MTIAHIPSDETLRQLTCVLYLNNYLFYLITVVWYASSTIHLEIVHLCVYNIITYFLISCARKGKKSLFLSRALKTICFYRSLFHFFRCNYQGGVPRKMAVNARYCYWYFYKNKQKSPRIIYYRRKKKTDRFYRTGWILNAVDSQFNKKILIQSPLLTSYS